MSDDLKPCPFCGGEPFSFEDYGHSTAWEVGCSNAQCRVEPHVWEKTKDEAIASWNTRTKTKAEQAFDQQIADYVTELVEAAKTLMARWPTDQHSASPLYEEAQRLRAAVAKMKGEKG
jgi:Lar family restriction alleviation protein